LAYPHAAVTEEKTHALAVGMTDVPFPIHFVITFSYFDVVFLISLLIIRFLFTFSVDITDANCD
jgi:hypothetical protein